MRVVIGEDSALFREGLARLLEDAGHEVVGKAADAVTLVEVVEGERPDLAIIDVRMPPDGTDDGARAAKGIRARMPDLAIVLLSQHVETRHSVELVSQGRVGYMLKDRVFEVDDWGGELAPNDPDGVVSEARLVPIGEAGGLLRMTPWLEIVADYLEGRVAAGTLRFERWHEGGGVDVVLQRATAT